MKSPNELIVDRDIEALVKLKNNLEWFSLNQKSLGKFHKNQYIAIKDKRILDCDYDNERLIKRLRLNDYSDSIAVEFVTDS
jgi:hypothetical protein